MPHPLDLQERPQPGGAGRAAARPALAMTSLTLPGGIRSVAMHQADGYLPPRRFVDRLTSWPLASILAWRHEHLFADIDGDRTEVTDRVHTRIPDRLLRTMFAYRQRQLADDLAAHRWASLLHAVPLTVAVTGSSGLVGTALCALLTTGGHRVIRLVRREPSTGDERRWNPLDPHPDLLDGVDALIHLAGEPITGHFDTGHKAAIRDSRIAPTDRLGRLVARGRRSGPPVVMVGASAVGIYGPDRREEMLTETRSGAMGSSPTWSPTGSGRPTRPASGGCASCTSAPASCKPQLADRYGCCACFLKPDWAAGLATANNGPRGSAWTTFWTSICAPWSTRTCWVRSTPLPPKRSATPTSAAYWHESCAGRSIVPVPSLGPMLLLGQEGAEELALAGQRVIPARLTDVGHHFRVPTLEPALRHLLGRLP
jgi:hypothetical protein